MCGIVGIYRPKGEPVSALVIQKMADAIIHRGPDSQGQFINSDIGLGHRRLSVLDLSASGNQPMYTPDKDCVIVFNGEIYNHAEIRLKLQKAGYTFQSRSDTEVILAGYKHWGEKIIPMLNGMFAFAIWNNKTKEVIIARDRYGIKPLYVWIRNKELVFGSEIKAILQHPEYHTALNINALHEYFTFQNIFRFHTLFKDIQLLAPARVIKMNALGEINTYTYWDFNFTDRDEKITQEEATEETLRLFKQAVKRQMVADVPIGSYLSGGMDSGSITAIASQQTNRLTTFTCGFDMSSIIGREANFDERRDAELMANHFKTEHYEMVINAGDLSWSMPKVIWHLEDLRLGMSYPNFYISRLASKFVKVCMNGAGGDELYGGYPWRYYRIFKSVDQQDFFKEYYSFWQRLVDDNEKQNMFTDESLKKNTDKRSMFEVFSRVFTYNQNLKYDNAEDHIANCLYFEAKTFLHGLFIVTDKLSMANSLEERIPFLDNDLVDFAQKIPIKYKLGNLQKMKRMDENEEKKLRKFQLQFDDGKNVLRKAMKSLIPEQIINRQKQGFSAPDESWYRGENLEYVKEILLNKNAAYKNYINADFVEKTINEHVTKNINHRLLIWSLISFEWWCKIFLEGYKV